MDKVAVLLPEGKLFDQLFVEAISPAIVQASGSSSRLDTDLSAESKLGALCNGIEQADLVIADLTGANPSVLYGVGFAHGIGKKVLLLTRHLENFPLDRKKHNVIGYAGDRDFLKTELAAFFATGQVPVEKENARERFFQIFGEILGAHGYEHRGKIELENPTTFILYDQDMDLALVQQLARKARELGLRLKLM